MCFYYIFLGHSDRSGSDNDRYTFRDTISVDSESDDSDSSDDDLPVITFQRTDWDINSQNPIKCSSFSGNNNIVVSDVNVRLDSDKQEQDVASIEIKDDNPVQKLDSDTSIIIDDVLGFKQAFVSRSTEVTNPVWNQHRAFPRSKAVSTVTCSSPYKTQGSQPVLTIKSTHKFMYNPPMFGDVSGDQTASGTIPNPQSINVHSSNVHVNMPYQCSNFAPSQDLSRGLSVLSSPQKRFVYRTQFCQIHCVLLFI